MGASAKSLVPPLPRWAGFVFLGFVAAFYVAAAFFFTLDALYQVQPGGPECGPSAPCNVSPLYFSGTHTVEVLVGTLLVAFGTILLAVLLIARHLGLKRRATAA
jgi:hypothetical protein